MHRLFENRRPLVLASASPRRRLFLEELGLDYTLVRPTGVEPRPAEGESPAAYACRAAAAKAHAVARAVTCAGQPPALAGGASPAATVAANVAANVAADLVAHHVDVAGDAVIIAADTVVALGDVLLGKPRDAEDALRMLRMLAGRGHSVISAVSVIFPGGDEVAFYDATEVHFHAWPEAVLRAYAQCGEPLDKAGAYAIQGQGAFLVEAIRGSWSTVVGLPVTQLAALLLERGVIAAVGDAAG